LAAEDLSFLGPDLAPKLEAGMFDVLIGQSADRSKMLSTEIELIL
ncbi:MAG: hypothetical protein JO357_19460, partial [Hyphomicrobiales bacterium]|nr:hypothetical protein [Hyphomicrobiales bacterium]